MRTPSEAEIRELLDRQARKLAGGSPPQFDHARARAIREALWRRNVRLAEADPSTAPLRRERLRQRLTIRQLAERSKIDRTTINRVELHPHAGRTSTYGKLAKALSVPVQDIRP